MQAGLNSLSQQRQEFVKQEFDDFIQRMQNIVQEENKGNFSDEQQKALLQVIAQAVEYGVKLGAIAANLKES